MNGTVSRIGSKRQAPTLTDAEIFEAADDGRLVDLAIYRALKGPAREIPHDEEAIDAEVRERAEARLAELHTKVSEAESLFSLLAGLVGDNSVGAAAVNSAGIKLGEVREKLPIIRQVVRDLEA